MVDYEIVSAHVLYPSPSASGIDDAYVHLIKSAQQVFLGQDIQSVCRNHVMWRDLPFGGFVSFILQHSD